MHSSDASGRTAPAVWPGRDRKKRAAGLAALAALALSLALCVGSPSESPTAPPTPAAPGSTNQLAATAAPAREPSEIGPAVFPHEKHVKELEIECVTCHHETNAGPLTFPHKDYFDDFWIDCTTCHRAAGAAALEPQACSNCHHSRNGDVADETLSAKVVIHKNCWSCHDMGKGAKASSACKECHPNGS
jgi:hypothetical protein